MEAFVYRDQVVELDQADVDKRSISFSTPDRQFYIRFHFSSISRSRHWILREGFGEAEVLQTIQLPRRDVTFKLNRELFACYEKAHEIIARELRSWPIWEYKIKKLVDDALHKAREIVERAPPNHNYVVICCPVKVSYENVYDEEEAIRSAIERSTGENIVGMVPAAESSIDSLQKKVVMEPETNCSVCLDEINRGCEGLSMPCLHIFHEDCIKEWLNTSHYCPVCRFEMPTD